LSEIVRKALTPKAWCVFDRFSPFPAGERYRETIRAVGLGTPIADTQLQLKGPNIGAEILKSHGWKEGEKLIILNPAGAFETRNLAIENYTSFAKLCQNNFARCKFLAIGTSFISGKADYMKNDLGDQMIN